MKKLEKQKQEKKKVNEVQTFSVPLNLGKKIENISININTPSKLSKEQIIYQAFKFHSQGNIPEAAKYYQYFITLGFNDHRVFSNYGIILKSLGKLKEAESSTRKAIKLNPNLADIHYNLGNILNDLGKSQDAEVSYRKAIKINPNHAEAHSNLGNVLNDLGKFKEAEFENQKSIDISFLKNINYKYRKDYLKNINLSQSQYRQDLFVLSELDFKKNGFFVEFGSFDGLTGSNSYLLEKSFNWIGILAEPMISCHKKLKENRSVSIENKCVWKSSGQEILFNEPYSYKQNATIDSFSKNSLEFYKKGKRYKVKTISLLDLLDIHNAPKFIDYLSIDTEGSEYEIFNAFDFQKYKFRVITCEHNFTPMREKIYDLLIKNGYKRKLPNISKSDDWYVYDS